MPTGYTTGILDGSIKDFKQFATLCMRAFGATLHMRDENMDSPYEPRVPSDYYQNEIDKANELLKVAENLTDDEVVELRKAALLKSKQYHIKAIEKATHDLNLLNEILADATKYIPPTQEHTEIKNFMIQQITETKKFDGDDSYHRNELAKINQELNNLNPAVIRSQMFAQAENDLQYHTEELSKEIKRCNDSNKWVEQFLDSLQNKASQQ